MTPWLWRLGPIAWARPHTKNLLGETFVTEHHTWACLIGRLWIRQRSLPSGRPPVPLEAMGEPNDSPTRLHWVDRADPRPFCGEGLRPGVNWTLEWNYVTCAECRRLGLPRQLHHFTNDR